MKISDSILVALIAIALALGLVALKVFCVVWLWNSFLIGWAGLALPTITWGKAFFVSIALTIAVNGFSGNSRD